MKDTIFDLVDSPSEKTGTIFDLANNANVPEDSSFFSKIKDYGKTFLKGTAEGLVKLGQTVGPYEKGLQKEEGKYKFAPSKEEEMEKITEALEEQLPVEENFGQRTLRRVLKEAPTLLAFPGASLQQVPRIAAASLFGQTAEEMGAPEIVQSAAELTAFMGPSLAKKLLSSGKDKELINYAKKMGMTDEQITPLIQSEFKQKWLTKISPKKGQTEKALKSTHEALGKVYQTVQESPAAAQEISEISNGKLINGIRKFMDELPTVTKNVIKEDLQELLDNKITGKSLMQFWKKLNQTMKGDNKALGILKEPVREAISSISPDLQKDFSMVNQLYTKYYPIATRLKPSLASDLISQAEITGGLAALGAAVSGNPFYLKAILGEQAIKKVAQQMLINPRLQQLSKKAVEAMNNNKPGIVKKVMDEYARQIEKTSPELAEEIRELKESEFKDLLMKHHEDNK